MHEPAGHVVVGRLFFDIIGVEPRKELGFNFGACAHRNEDGKHIISCGGGTERRAKKYICARAVGAPVRALDKK